MGWPDMYNSLAGKDKGGLVVKLMAAVLRGFVLS
jgi:hypothetical protein